MQNSSSYRVKHGGQGRDRTGDLSLFSSQADTFPQVAELHPMPLTWAFAMSGYTIGYGSCDIAVTHLGAGYLQPNEPNNRRVAP